MERTLIILKPEVLERRIMGKIISYWDGHGFDLVACKQMTGTEEQFRVHYADVLKRVDKVIGDSIIERMIRGPCIYLIYEGEDVVKQSRKMIGATNPKKAGKNTIRLMYGDSVEYNVVHGSDSIQNALREISIWFPEHSKVMCCGYDCFDSIEGSYSVCVTNECELPLCDECHVRKYCEKHRNC